MVEFIMTFNNTKESFLNNCTEGDFYDSSLTTYRRKLDVFSEFLTNDYGANDNNYKDILRGINQEAITKSIEYYVKSYGISFKNTIDTYLSVIKSYFDFLSKELNIKNDNFDSAIGYSNIKNSVEEKVKELELEVTNEQKPPIAEHIFSKLLSVCNDVLNKHTLEYIIDTKNKAKNSTIQTFTSAIIVKLVMFTGIKNQVIDTIKLKDYDDELNIITINNFSIHLPNKLGKQMKVYLQLRDKLIGNTDKDFQLFVKRDGTSIGTAYDYAFKVLKDTLNSTSSEGIAKYTIMQMIKKGMNIYMIKMLTKFGIESCLQCQELVNDEKTNEDITSQNRYIDSKIRSMDIFDLL